MCLRFCQLTCVYHSKNFYSSILWEIIVILNILILSFTLIQTDVFLSYSVLLMIFSFFCYIWAISLFKSENTLVILKCLFLYLTHCFSLQVHILSTLSLNITDSFSVLLMYFEYRDFKSIQIYIAKVSMFLIATWVILQWSVI